MIKLTKIISPSLSKEAMIEEEKNENDDGLGRHSSYISMLGAIGLYQALLRKKKIQKFGAASNRLEELITRYTKGERYFAGDT